MLFGDKRNSQTQHEELYPTGVIKTCNWLHVETPSPQLWTANDHRICQVFELMENNANHIVVVVRLTLFELSPFFVSFTSLVSITSRCYSIETYSDFNRMGYDSDHLVLFRTLRIQRSVNLYPWADVRRGSWIISDLLSNTGADHAHHCS